MTKHTCNDGRGPAFGRLSPMECVRCAELNAGAPIREWRSHKADDARRIAEIRSHDCKASRCGPVCTFGEW